MLKAAVRYPWTLPRIPKIDAGALLPGASSVALGSLIVVDLFFFSLRVDELSVPLSAVATAAWRPLSCERRSHVPLAPGVYLQDEGGAEP